MQFGLRSRTWSDGVDGRISSNIMHIGLKERGPGKKQISILFASFRCSPPDFGGELFLCYNRFYSLAKRGHHVTLASRKPSVVSPSLVTDVADCLYSPVSGGGFVARFVYPFWVVLILLGRRFDSVHLGDMSGNRYSYRVFGAMLITGVAKMRGAKTIAVSSLADSNSGLGWDTRGKRGLAKKLFYMHVDRVVGVSPALFNGVKEWDPMKARYIPNAVRDDRYFPVEPESRFSLRRKYGLGMSDVVFITIGAIGARKGHDILAKCFAKLASNDGRYKLWMVGPSTKEEGCNASDREINEVFTALESVKQNVRIFGRVTSKEKLRDLLGVSDVFVFPTRREGMPLSPMEAMSMGLPVIVSLLEGITDVACVEGETGFFVPPGDADALEIAMERLAVDGDLRKKQGEMGRKRIADQFGWERHIDRWELLYERGDARTQD